MLVYFFRADYCGIIIACSCVTNVLAFISNPSPRIYIPTNIYMYKHLFNIYKNDLGLATNKNMPPQTPNKFGYPRTQTSTNKNDFTVLITSSQSTLHKCLLSKPSSLSICPVHISQYNFSKIIEASTCIRLMIRNQALKV